jgi:hypothetical protein
MDGLCLSNAHEKIKQRDVQISYKTLGTYKYLIREENSHIGFLRKKSDNMGELVLKSQFNRRQARVAYNSCYIPAILYSLTAVSLNQDQSNKNSTKSNNQIYLQMQI